MVWTLLLAPFDRELVLFNVVVVDAVLVNVVPLDICGERGEGGVPGGDQPLLEVDQPVWRQGVEVARAAALVVHQAGALEHLEVLADGRPPDRHGGGDLADRSGALGEELEDLATTRVAEGIEGEG
jgi:hypothetical protein